MYVGACAGSTGGGIKVSRVVLASKTVKREIKRVLHPHAYEIIRMDGKPVAEETTAGVGVFLILYVGIVIGSVFLVSFDGYDFDTTFSSVSACLNNIGPAWALLEPRGIITT
jgi:trk system potassium uptake protein TrkH